MFGQYCLLMTWFQPVPGTEQYLVYSKRTIARSLPNFVITWLVYSTKYLPHSMPLTHWGRVMHICISNLTITGSDNGLSPGQHQAIIWPNARILLIGTQGTKFSEMSSKILTFSFKKMHLRVSAAKWQPFCLGLTVLEGFMGMFYLLWV